MNGQNTQTSQNTQANLSPQKPLTRTSSLASSFLYCRFGLSKLHQSVAEAEAQPLHPCMQTSRRRPAVKSLSSLCRIDGYPPLGHDRACVTVKSLPQAQSVGRDCGCQPQHRQRPSRKAVLCKQNPCLFNGMAESQLDEPFSAANSNERRQSSSKLDFSAEVTDEIALTFSVLANFLLCIT